MLRVLQPANCWECGWDSQDPTYFFPYPYLDKDGVTKLTKHYCSVCWMALTDVSPVVYNSDINQPEQKEEKMETLTPETYNPNALVTYKKIAGTYAQPEAPEYITDKVVDLEWKLDQGQISNNRNVELNNKVFKLENILSSYCQEATDPDMELITEIAELFDIRLTKDISFTGTMSFSGTVTVDLTEDFDLESLLGENLTVDAYSGDIEISDYSVEDVREDY